MPSPGKDVSVITLSDSEDDRTVLIDSSFETGSPEFKIDRKPLEDATRDCVKENSSFCTPLEDDSICIIEEPELSSEQPDTVPVSLDDSVIVIDSLSNQKKVPKVKQWYCKDITASRRVITAHKHIRHRKIKASGDVRICEVSSTTNEPDLPTFPRKTVAAPEFIPLTSKRKPEPRRAVVSKRKKLAVSEASKLSSGNESTLPSHVSPVLTQDSCNTLPSMPVLNNASRIADPSSPARLRPIVIDGSNVAHFHGEASQTYSCKGIQLCIDYFMKRGHTQITAFVPQYRRHADKRKDFPTVDGHILDELAKKQLLVYTPSRKIDGHRVGPYDDRFIINLAIHNGGVIVSNDNFRDLVDVDASYRTVIQERCLSFCFVGDLFMVPDDPLGRNGPTLKEFLEFRETEQPSSS